MAIGFITAIGNDPQMRRAAYAISQAGGGPASLEASLNLAARTGDTGIDRPWKWLAEVVEHPGAAANHQLVARIAFVVLYWHVELRDKLGMGDVSDMMLQAPPAAVVARSCAALISHLRDVDEDAVFAEGSFGVLTLGGIKALCSEQAVA